MAISTPQPAVAQAANVTGLKAGFVSRAIALVLDIFIVLVLAGVSYLFISGTLTLMRIDISQCTEFVPITGLVSFFHNICHISRFLLAASLALIAPLYFLLFWLFAGRTVGMGIAGCRVVRTNGARLGLSAAIVRLLGYVLCLLTLGIGFLWAIIDDDRQGLHDKIARTYVIYWSGKLLHAYPPPPLRVTPGVPLPPRSSINGGAGRVAAPASEPAPSHPEEKV